MAQPSFPRKFLWCGAILGMAVSGCAATQGMTIGGRTALAEEIAAMGELKRRDISTGDFILASWQKITQPGAPIYLYIEGDGSSWISKTVPSGNPTPKDPVALRLAVLDPAPNVVYLARPCHYTDLGIAGNECDSVYWRGRRFAPEVVASYQRALDEIKARSGSAGFHVIGFSGGANVAGLLAAERDDIYTLRTVAGNIDNDFFMAIHKVSPTPESLNMADQAERLSYVPQLHFIGKQDEVVTPEIFIHYKGLFTRTDCIGSKVVANANHSHGWVEQWQALRSQPVPCEK